MSVLCWVPWEHHADLVLPLNPLSWHLSSNWEVNWLVWLGKRKPRRLLGPCLTSGLWLSFFRRLLTGQIDWRRPYLRKFTTSTDARILYTGHFSFSHGNEGTSSSLGFALLVRSVSRVQNQDRILPTPARLARESAPTRRHSLLALYGSRALSPHI